MTRVRGVINMVKWWCMGFPLWKTVRDVSLDAVLSSFSSYIGRKYNSVI
jgi:hypothetical protein